MVRIILPSLLSIEIVQKFLFLIPIFRVIWMKLCTSNCLINVYNEAENISTINNCVQVNCKLEPACFFVQSWHSSCASTNKSKSLYTQSNSSYCSNIPSKLPYNKHTFLTTKVYNCLHWCLLLLISLDITSYPCVPLNYLWNCCKTYWVVFNWQLWLVYY